MPPISRIAVVSGGARGIGLSCVRRLLNEGLTVVSVDLDHGSPRGKAAASDKSSLITFDCDVSDPEQVADLAEEVRKRFERCDVLINNVGIFPFKPFDQLGFEEFKRVMTINVDSMFLMSSAFSGGMRERGWGRIVNLGASMTLSQAREFLAYMTSKGAVHAMTRALANELGDAGVTVNAIAPSIIGTEGNHSRTGLVNGMTFEDEQLLMLSLQTLKRPQLPEDVANAVAFLVSDDADFITGQIIHVNGGMTRTAA